jgi:hypothetical protein
VPFEVTDKPAAGGWTFLSDADAQAAASGRIRSPGTTFICRPGKGGGTACRPEADDLEALFALRRELLPQLAATPYVEEEAPVVCAWKRASAGPHRPAGHGTGGRVGRGRRCCLRNWSRLTLLSARITAVTALGGRQRCARPVQVIRESACYASRRPGGSR